MFGGTSAQRGARWAVVGNEVGRRLSGHTWRRGRGGTRRPAGSDTGRRVGAQHRLAGTARVSAGGYDEVVAEQAQKWLSEAAVPEDVVARSHVGFAESFADGLIQEVARLEADAIVVGGSGGGLAGPYSLGSVVNELLHSSPVPVAVAPRGTRDSDVERVREVTCAIGERQGADLLLRTAVRFSKAAGTPLRLASLVALDPTFGSLRGDGDAVRERARAHAQQTMDTAKEALPEGIPVTSTIVDGSTVEEAVGRLEWHDGDLIMVGSNRLKAHPARSSDPRRRRCCASWTRR